MPVCTTPVYVPWQLLAVHLAEAGEVMGSSGLLVGRRGERSSGLVAVRGGWRGGVVPLCGTGSVLAALHQVGPLWERGAPLLFRATWTNERHTVRCYMTTQCKRRSLILSVFFKANTEGSLFAGCCLPEQQPVRLLKHAVLSGSTQVGGPCRRQDCRRLSFHLGGILWYSTIVLLRGCREQPVSWTQLIVL